MKCAYHTDRDAKTQCNACGKPVCEACMVKVDGGRVLCSACVAAEALADVSSEIKDRNARRAKTEAENERLQLRRSRNRNAALWAVLVLCIIVMGAQWARVYQAGRPPKPIRTGIQDTDAVTDQCIHNLWIASSALSRGQAPPADLRCPASGAAYIVEKRGDDTYIKCPNPSQHGLSAIRVSRFHPVPEAVR